MAGDPRTKNSGLNGALPTEYDPNWKLYTDLSPQQIAAFQGFPMDLTQYAAYKRWIWEVCGQSENGPATSYITLPGTNPNLDGLQLYTSESSQNKVQGLVQGIDKDATNEPHNFKAVNGYRSLASLDVKQMFGYMTKWVQTTFDTESSLLDGINATPPTITTRAQIDQAYQTAMAAVIAA